MKKTLLILISIIIFAMFLLVFNYLYFENIHKQNMKENIKKYAFLLKKLNEQTGEIEEIKKEFTKLFYEFDKIISVENFFLEYKSINNFNELKQRVDLYNAYGPWYMSKYIEKIDIFLNIIQVNIFILGILLTLLIIIYFLIGRIFNSKNRKSLL